MSDDHIANVLRALVENPDNYELLVTNPYGLRDVLGLSDADLAEIDKAGEAHQGETLEAGTVSTTMSYGEIQAY